VADERRDVGYLSSRLGSANPAGVAESDAFRADWLPRLPGQRDARILEIGYGLGDVLDLLKEHGYTRYEGVDVDRECYEYCVPRHPVFVSADVRAFLEAAKATYDAILMKEVLGFIPPDEVTSYLRTVRQALAPGGTLVLQSFNAALFTSYYTRSNDAGYRAAYTEHSLRQVLVAAGFEHVTIEGNRSTKTGARAIVYGAARSAWVSALRLVFLLERGRGNNPTIYSKLLIATASAGPSR